MMPASTSPITRGCPSFGITLPHSRANTITTSAARKNATTIWSGVRWRVAETCSDGPVAAADPVLGAPATGTRGGLELPPRRGPGREPLAAVATVDAAGERAVTVADASAIDLGG